LTRRANQRHFFIIPKSCMRPSRPAMAGASMAIAAENPRPKKHFPETRIAPDRRGPRDRLRVAEPRLAARVPGRLDMSTAPAPISPTTTAATDQTKAAAAPRIRLSSHGFAIDHPDPALGEQLMADTLGVADRDAMHGMLRQLVKASVSGESPDEVNLSFMISMVRSIRPRDSVEAMLVAQMVSVHVMAMRCAHHLASAEDLARHDSAARALGRLARTFPAQIEALNRYRSQGEPAITVQNVSVGDGGNAFVGNVTQHASVIVSDKNPASAARTTPKAPGSRRRRVSAEARREAKA
jgi:hypothetical protein